MAEETLNQDSNWPMPKFHFNVDLGNQTSLTFQEVSGLDAETESIEFRHGDSSNFSTGKDTGEKKFTHVTMKKGVSAT